MSINNENRSYFSAIQKECERSVKLFAQMMLDMKEVTLLARRLFFMIRSAMAGKEMRAHQFSGFSTTANSRLVK